MNKAVLVFDMPESCWLCPFCYDYQGTYDLCIASASMYKYRAYFRFRPLEKLSAKPEWCPLKKLPEKLEYGGFVFNGEVKGWNNFRQKILE